MPEDYEETPLYGGDTRPALMRWIGLPLTVATPLVLAVPLIFNWMSSWRWRIAALVVDAGFAIFFWFMLRYDHNAVRILNRWFSTKFMSFDAKTWKGASPDPFPTGASKHPLGIYDD